MKNDSKGVHALCSTRWTVRGESLESILNNFDELMELWDWSLENLRDTQMKARIGGVKAAMPTFDYLYSSLLAIMFLKQTDNLSRTLQDPKISAAEGNEIAQDVSKCISKDRNDTSFNLFWEYTLKKKDQLHIDGPELPRKRRVPRRYHDGNSNDYFFPSTPKDHYHQIYFETLDTVLASIKERFDQPDFRKYQSLQELFLKAVKGQPWNEEIKEVCSIYGDDLDKYRLEAQLPLLKATANSMNYELQKFTVHDLIRFLQGLSHSRKIAMSEIIKAAKILLVMPATNASSERSFSALKRVKTYLRSSTTDHRLNHLLMLHVHQEKVDNLDMISVANDFVERNDRRKQVFGTFTERDTCKKLTFSHKSTQTA